MEKNELPETVHGVDVIFNNPKDSVFSIFSKSLLGPEQKVTYTYYELYNDLNGEVSFVVENKYVAISAAARLGLKYRAVTFDVLYKTDN